MAAANLPAIKGRIMAEQTAKMTPVQKRQQQAKTPNPKIQ
jgi:hypothetical protein